tara:strand:- start:68 stop:541 length:474 start_codon:yes stop_codon:yes gene_type:complete
MRGKHAKQASHKLVAKLEGSVSKLKTLHVLERKKRMGLERRLTKQSSLIDEIARLRKQNDTQVSDKYLKLENHYIDLRKTVAGFKKREKTHDRTMGILIGMYAKECGITRTEAIDAWTARVTGEKDVMVAFETPEGKGPLWGLMEKMRRKKFEMRNR